MQKQKLSRALAAQRGPGSAAEIIEEILLGVSPACAETRIHDLTTAERAVIANQLRLVLDELPRVAPKAGKRLVKAEEEQAKARALLDKAPEESVVGEMLAKLQQLERKVGAYQAQLERLDEALQEARYKLTVAYRELSRAQEAVGRSDDSEHRSALAARAVAALEDFEVRAQAAKLHHIERETARYFNRLSRKGELLSLVRIDPENFRVSLRRWDSSELPKERLSAGEKQLLAIALLWALTQTSGRRLPVVIDTPLARLDRSHRERLLTEYFPAVSQQVVVLSTDTEVDAAAAATLAPATVRSFHLDHDADLCQTKVRDGYFVDLEQEARVAR